MADSDHTRPDEVYRAIEEGWHPSPSRPRINHPVAAARFLEEIEFLRAIMKERNVAAWQRPFDDVLALVREVGMLRDGDWDPYWLDPASPHVDDSMAIELVDQLIDADRAPAPLSRRIAVASAVAEFSLPGNSFDAACKRLTRLLAERDKYASDKR